ncbi:head-tail adaptor protein [Actinomycetaceae bacterium WB03_NA08]|uniref:Head-tail adaptor protein n=1 Tax=Scrofimicrobium canadense TaxID=2652290 RepID=A0A6N7W9F2_9ACTO|nr:head-tail adaptor protein [Scrofimicrobium canadense]MSS84778.1 head-tail adaptor protein [Scrofimicrobium canadense]
MASLGSMRTTVDLIQPVVERDAAGFTSTRDEIRATVRAYVETRHASAAWVNRAAYTKADRLFRIRTIPGLAVTTDMEITGPDSRYRIDSAEQIGRYVEILAHTITPEGS